MNEIPGFQEMMLPVLNILADGKEHSRQQLIREVADFFQLTEKHRGELLSSGTDTVVGNRTTWATIYLEKAELVAKPKRAVFIITENGRKLLKSPPSIINIAFLKQNFPVFAKWRFKEGKEPIVIQPVERTPEEIFEETHKLLRQNLIVELLEKIKSESPQFFERLVVDLLLKMGYGGSHQDAGKVVGKSGDGGIDGMINEDKLGLDTIYIQAKRYEAPVPISHIRDFAGTLSGKKTKKGIFITTSSFPQTAYEFVKTVDGRIILVDGEQLAELMIDNNLGVTIQYSYEIKRIDSDYFEEL